MECMKAPHFTTSFLKAWIQGCDISIQGKCAHIVWPFISHVDHHWTFNIFQILQRLSWFSRPMTSILSTVACFHPHQNVHPIIQCHFGVVFCFHYGLLLDYLYVTALLFTSATKPYGQQKGGFTLQPCPQLSCQLCPHLNSNINFYTQPPSLLSMILPPMLMRPCGAQDWWDGALIQWGSGDGTSNQPGSRGSGKLWESYLPRFVFLRLSTSTDRNPVTCSQHTSYNLFVTCPDNSSRFEEMTSSVKGFRITLGLLSELVSGITSWAHSDLIGSSLMYRAKTCELWRTALGLVLCNQDSAETGWGGMITL